MNGFEKGEVGEIIIEVRDKDGNLVVKRKEKMNSFLMNYYRLTRSFLIEGASIQLKDVNGNMIPSGALGELKLTDQAKAPKGEDSYGVVVGSGSTSVDVMSDYNLANKITNGTGTGQLSYGDTTIIEGPHSPPVLVLDVKRSFSNQSGGNITVNEIGVVLKINDGSSDYYVMITRDVISPVTIPNGGTLNVTVRFKVN